MRRNWAKLFGKQLAKLRHAKGVKQHELEDKIGSGAQYVSHLETGRSKPSFDNVFELADALDVSPMDLLFVQGVDDDQDALRKRIDTLMKSCSEDQLRKIYRLLLVCLEE
jgi:transcriptional regulator with XRE-family HTH domain